MLNLELKVSKVEKSNCPNHPNHVELTATIESKAASINIKNARNNITIEPMDGFAAPPPEIFEAVKEAIFKTIPEGFLIAPPEVVILFIIPEKDWVAMGKPNLGDIINVKACLKAASAIKLPDRTPPPNSPASPSFNIPPDCAGDCKQCDVPLEERAITEPCRTRNKEIADRKPDEKPPGDIDATLI